MIFQHNQFASLTTIGKTEPYLKPDLKLYFFLVDAKKQMNSPERQSEGKTKRVRERKNHAGRGDEIKRLI